jgi:murein biosynthesis integral membrane protein MurJ
VVALITVAVKFLGFGEKVVLAYYLGTGPEIDAYVIAFSVPFMIFIVVRELIEPAYLPTFMETIGREGEHSGGKLFSTVANALMVILAAVTVFGILFAPSLVSFLAPGFHDVKRELAVRFTRMIMPATLFLGVSTLTYITLNAYKRFAVPAIGDVAFKGIAIGVLVLSYGFIGVKGLIIGVVIGAAARLGVHTAGLWRKRSLYSPGIDFTHPAFKKMRRLMLPLVIGIAFSQLSLLIDNMFASTLETGSISSLSYAKKLVEMPIIVLPYALGIVIFPFFSELAISHEEKKLQAMLLQGLRLLAFLFIPMAVGMIVLRTSLVRVLFERGAFGGHSTYLTSSVLFYYALGLFSFAVEAVLVQFYFSIFDTKTPIVVGILCVVLNILLTVILIRPLGHRGIALALTVSKSIKVVMLYALLKKKMISFEGGGLFAFTAKVLCASICMGAAVFGIGTLASSRFPGGFLGRSLNLGALTVCGVVLYMLLLIVLRTDEVALYYRYAREFLGGIAGRGDDE